MPFTVMYDISLRLDVEPNHIDNLSVENTITELIQSNISNCQINTRPGEILASYGILPAAAVGVIGNLFAFWIWRTDLCNYNVTTFLFRCLAMCDTAYLCLNFAFVLLLETACCQWYHIFVTHARNLSQILSVHITLLVAVTRWMAVQMPLHVHRYLTKCAMKTSCVTIAVWCLAIEGMEVARKNLLLLQREDVNKPLFVLHEVLSYVLPIFLLSIFSIHIIWTFKRHFASSAALQAENKTRIDARKVDKTFFRLTLTVLCVALSSFVAYPIGVTVEMVSLLELSVTCQGLFYYDVLATVGGFLQTINSGINICFYCVFVSRFRKLVRFRLQSLFHHTFWTDNEHYNASSELHTSSLNRTSLNVELSPLRHTCNN